MICVPDRDHHQATAHLAALERMLNAMEPEEERRLRSLLDYHAPGQLDPLGEVLERLDHAEPEPLLDPDD